MKSYTDIEQSKKLAEILPLESADMWWNIELDDDNEIDGYTHSFYLVTLSDIPCWSLAALLDVLPQGTRLLKSATDDTYHCDCPKGNIGKWFENSIDACYELILKLKEQNLL